MCLEYRKYINILEFREPFLFSTCEWSDNYKTNMADLPQDVYQEYPRHYIIYNIFVQNMYYKFNYIEIVKCVFRTKILDVMICTIC